MNHSDFVNEMTRNVKSAVKENLDLSGKKFFVLEFPFSESQPGGPAQVTYRIQLLNGPMMNWENPDYYSFCKRIDREEIEPRSLREEFGDHRFFADVNEILGYRSPDVPPRKIKELAEIWKDILTKVGFELGEEKWTGDLNRLP